ncbi:transcription factor 15-like [Pristis pectinata]|uniref:transcription factor 15-like n=1 Tax=Pristis pectinata TaxID=685728 RepID=UPI00223CDDE1|nr:transcription factor 15-like [Pristis pectinata]
MDVLHGVCVENSDQDKRSAKKKKIRRRKKMLTGVSRQRRAANTRERQRVHGVNLAFQDLRKLLPVLSEVEVSKIDILRLAAKWIAHLTTVLLLDDQKQHQRENGLSVELGEKLTELTRVCEELATDFIICQTEDPLYLGGCAIGDFSSLRSFAGHEMSLENGYFSPCLH